MEIFSPTCKDFVPVCLMAHIPNKLVIWCIEYVVKRNRQFHHAETSTKMTTKNGYIVNDKLA